MAASHTACYNCDATAIRPPRCLPFVELELHESQINVASQFTHEARENLKYLTKNYKWLHWESFFLYFPDKQLPLSQSFTLNFILQYYIRGFKVA